MEEDRRLIYLNGAVGTLAAVGCLKILHQSIRSARKTEVTPHMLTQLSLATLNMTQGVAILVDAVLKMTHNTADSVVLYSLPQFVINSCVCAALYNVCILCFQEYYALKYQGLVLLITKQRQQVFLMITWGIGALGFSGELSQAILSSEGPLSVDDNNETSSAAFSTTLALYSYVFPCTLLLFLAVLMCYSYVSTADHQKLLMKGEAYQNRLKHFYILIVACVLAFGMIFTCLPWGLYSIYCSLFSLITPYSLSLLRNMSALVLVIVHVLSRTCYKRLQYAFVENLRREKCLHGEMIWFTEETV